MHKDSIGKILERPAARAGMDADQLGGQGSPVRLELTEHQVSVLSAAPPIFEATKVAGKADFGQISDWASLVFPADLSTVEFTVTTCWLSDPQ